MKQDYYCAQSHFLYHFVFVELWEQQGNQLNFLSPINLLLIWSVTKPSSIANQLLISSHTRHSFLHWLLPISMCWCEWEKVEGCFCPDKEEDSYMDRMPPFNQTKPKESSLIIVGWSPIYGFALSVRLYVLKLLNGFELFRLWFSLTCS